MSAPACLLCIASSPDRSAPVAICLSVLDPDGIDGAVRVPHGPPPDSFDAARGFRCLRPIQAGSSPARFSTVTLSWCRASRPLAVADRVELARRLTLIAVGKPVPLSTAGACSGGANNPDRHAGPSRSVVPLAFPGNP